MTTFAILTALLGFQHLYPEQDAGKIRKYINRLDSDDIRIRTEAEQDLLDLGERARTSLRKASEGGNPERSVAAKRSLHVLDRRKAVAAIRRHSGKFGKFGYVWIGRKAFPGIAHAKSLPEYLKPLEKKARSVNVILAEIERGRIKSARFTNLIMADVPALAGLTSHEGISHSAREWFRRARPSKARNLFGVWPEMGRSTHVFIQAQPMLTLREYFQMAAEKNGRKRLEADALDSYLEAAGKHRQSEFRAVAAWILRDRFEVKYVEMALAMFDDEAHNVRSAAMKSLKILVDPPKGGPARIRAWWKKLSKEDRQQRLDEQKRNRMNNRKPCCTDD